MNPAQLVPTLQLDEKRKLHESLVICDYLDTAYPGNNLIPTDPYEFAMHKLIVQDFNKSIGLFYKLAKKLEIGMSSQLNAALAEFMKHLEGGQFFGGDKPLYADFMVNIKMWFIF